MVVVHEDECYSPVLGSRVVVVRFRALYQTWLYFVDLKLGITPLNVTLLYYGIKETLVAVNLSSNVYECPREPGKHAEFRSVPCAIGQTSSSGDCAIHLLIQALSLADVPSTSKNNVMTED